MKPKGNIRPDALRRSFIRLKEKCGITRSLKPHDLRRTTATRVYKNTKDLRLVQALLGHSDLGSTFWYLDNEITPVKAEELELAKLNVRTETIQ
jgi:integrase